MCDKCGCDTATKETASKKAQKGSVRDRHDHEHVHADGTVHSHSHGHADGQTHNHVHTGSTLKLGLKGKGSSSPA